MFQIKIRSNPPQFFHDAFTTFTYSFTGTLTPFGPPGSLMPVNRIGCQVIGQVVKLSRRW
jgi:hypothetical protein